MPRITKVSLKDKFNSFNDLWSPKVVGALNAQYVKLAKFQGEYVWHHHDQEDEMFLVIKGSMRICLKDGADIELNEGEFAIIPRGIEHKPVSDELCHALLFEPATTRNTGQVDHKYTIEPGDLDHI